MSKYIRTEKYGICEITHEDERTIHYENSLVSGCLWKDDVEYQTANTIEELCDAFVVEDRGHFGIIGDIEAKEICVDKTITVYGAIWTDKGLIFVACMNDKGELKLL